MSSSDKIEKQVTLRAPIARVWSAITDSQQFGVWFGCALEAPFEVGKKTSGTMKPTQVDADVAKMQASYAGTPIVVSVERIEPMRVFAFHWHPYEPEPGMSYDSVPMTLVTFEFSEVEPGTTHLKITESGFDRIPLERRARAFSDNEGGWTHQLRLIEKYVYGAAAGR